MKHLSFIVVNFHTFYFDTCVIIIVIITTCKFFCAEYSMLMAVITGSGFLWHQIRCIMGVLFLIGQEKEQPDVVLELLDVVKNPW